MATLKPSTQSLRLIVTAMISRTRINVVGSVPSAVAGLSARVGAGGLLDVSWLAPADAVPPPTSYRVAVFAPFTPGSTPTPVASMTVPATGLTSMFTIPALYQLGANSPTGVWTVAVQPINSTGSGTPSRANFVVTTALKKSLALQAALVQDLQDIPIGLQEIEAAECAAGVSTVSPVTGTCSNGIFTPSR